jgi:Protein of unknown function (DUF3071)
MRQLRLVGLAEDGGSLLLESPTGDSYRLVLDERVRAACRGDLTRLGQIEIETDNPLRPREIQMRVRAGESAESVAASSGMPLDRVLRFASAVLQERSRVVAQARSTAVRPAAAEQLGPLVEERLVSRGTDAATLRWDAWRRDDGRWAVQLSWRHGERTHAAHWSLDLGRRALQPEDPAAEQLTAKEFHARTITAVTPLAVAARAASETTRPGGAPPAERPRPTRGERAPADPTPADGARSASDPGRADRPPSGGRTDHAPAEHARADHASAERPRTAPDRSRADHGPGDRAHPDRAQGDRAHPDRAQGDRARADHTPGDRARSATDRADHTPGDRARSATDRADQAATERARPEPDSTRAPADRERTAPERTGRMAAEPATDKGRGRTRRPRDTAPDEDDDRPPAREGRIAAGGGTIPLLDAAPDEDDRARRATVPSWDDILLGVRRRH